MQMLKGPRHLNYILAHGMLEALAGRVLAEPAPPRTDDAHNAEAEAAVRRLLTKARLNESQRQAVLSTLFPQAPMQIVHGPPGTGEHECICMTGASFVRRPPRCLLCETEPGLVGCPTFFTRMFTCNAHSPCGMPQARPT